MYLLHLAVLFCVNGRVWTQAKIPRGQLTCLWVSWQRATMSFREFLGCQEVAL